MGDLLDLDEEMLLTLHEVHENGWTRSEQLLASVVDAVQVTAYNALVGPNADVQKLRKIKPPKPIERPGRHRRRRGTTLGQLAAMGARPTYVKEEGDG